MLLFFHVFFSSNPQIVSTGVLRGLCQDAAGVDDTLLALIAHGIEEGNALYRRVCESGGNFLDVGDVFAHSEATLHFKNFSCGVLENWLLSVHPDTEDPGSITLAADGVTGLEGDPAFHVFIMRGMSMAVFVLPDGIVAIDSHAHPRSNPDVSGPFVLVADRSAPLAAWLDAHYGTSSSNTIVAIQPVLMV
jgi:hypothetical protein